MIAEAKVISVLDNFLEKASGVNKPYKAIQKTDEFKAFQEMMTDGIKTQADWTSSNLSDLFDKANIKDDLQPLTLDQEQRLTKLLAVGMPGMEKIVGSHKVFLFYKFVFEFAVKSQYKRLGYLVKSEDYVNFELTNPAYISALEDDAAYLLNRSSIDDTTLKQIIQSIRESKLAGMTNDEVSSVLSDQFIEISETRGDLIARTETANAMGSGNLATMQENGVEKKHWVIAGEGKDDLCQENESDGDIPVDSPFSSGDMNEPAHPNCECYTEAAEIDLDAIDLWNGN